MTLLAMIALELTTRDLPRPTQIAADKAAKGGWLSKPEQALLFTAAHYALVSLRRENEAFKEKLRAAQAEGPPGQPAALAGQPAA
jgi:hypothetical protein